MSSYTIIIEKTSDGYSGYVPDLPGCISVGDTRDELVNHLKEAINLYIEEVKLQGIALPQPSTSAELIEVD
ncbi:MAG: type II toxin-antitoxin system HicB family antitoxin [Cyclobacteriaceae bacterium]